MSIVEGLVDVSVVDCLHGNIHRLAIVRIFCMSFKIVRSYCDSCNRLVRKMSQSRAVVFQCMDVEKRV